MKILIEKEHIFKNKFTLNMYNCAAEKEYKKCVEKSVSRANKWASLLNVAFSIINVLFHKRFLEYGIENNIDWIKTTQKLSHFILVIFVVNLIFSFFKNSYFQKICKSINFVFCGFFFFILRNFLFGCGLIDEHIYSLISIFEISLRIIMIFFHCLNLPDGYIICLLFIFINTTFISFLFHPIKILNYFTTTCLILIIAYFYNKQVKFRIFQKYAKSKKIVWFENVIDHFNCGIIKIKNGKLNYINRTFIETLLKNKKILEFFEKNVEKNNKDEFTINKIKESYLSKSKSKEVIKLLLTDFLSQDNEIKHYRTLNEFIEDIKNFLNDKSKNCSFKMKKFNFFGFKILKIHYDAGIPQPLTFEVFFRYKKYKQNEEIELTFYDISRIKESEKINAEWKLKTQFLTKVEHEFKNPLICMNELIDQISDNLKMEPEKDFLQAKELFNNIDKFKLNPERTESPKKNFSELVVMLEHLKSFSNYLQILIDNFEYFSVSKKKKEIVPDLKITDLEDILKFCKQIWEILLLKFQKKVNLKFEIGKNINFPFLIKLDANKLKQILINLLANAVKFINYGTVQIVAEYDEERQVLKFDMTDTGPGIEQENLKTIFSSQPFDSPKMTLENKLSSGLGVYVVIEILKQLGSELKVDSEVGKGSKFSFSLPLEVIKIKIDNNDHDLTPNSFPGNNNSENDSQSTITIKNLNLTLPDKRLFKNFNFSYPEANSEHEEILTYNSSVSYYIVIDDEKLVRKSTIRNLHKAANKLGKSIEIIEGDDGLDCLYLVYKYIKNGFKISAIISDELMMYMNGSKSAEILKSLLNLNTQQFPFILLTAFNQTNSQFVDHFINKPLKEGEAEYLVSHY